jgi:hypothetical protein
VIDAASTDTLTYDEAPLSFAMTEFHLLLMYSSGKLIARNRLSGEIVFGHTFERGVAGTLKGLVSDPSTNSIWLFSELRVYQINVDRESRSIWKIYLNRALKTGAASDFTRSNLFCETLGQREEVRVAQADYLFSVREYDEAAKVYASSTSSSFESVVLQFLNEGQILAVKTYLLTKLSSYGREDKSQRTLLATWLVEIYLGQINGCKAEVWDLREVI